MNSYVCLIGYGNYSEDKLIPKDNAYSTCREILSRKYRDVLMKFTEPIRKTLPVYFGHVSDKEFSIKLAKGCISLLKATIKDPSVEYSIVNYKDISLEECPDKPVLYHDDFYLVKINKPINRWDLSLALLYSWFGWDEVNPLNKAYFILRKYSDYIPDLFVEDITINKKCLYDPACYTNGPESFLGSLNSSTENFIFDLLDKYYDDNFGLTYSEDTDEYNYEEEDEDALEEELED